MKERDVHNFDLGSVGQHLRVREQVFRLFFVMLMLPKFR
jgi:hypothetical protein